MDHHEQHQPLDLTKANYEEEQDRISQLPDSVLSYLLSKFTIKDLVRTRLLSKKWLNLWELRTNLNFDIPNMFNHDLPPHVVHNNGKGVDLVYLNDITREFVMRVTQFMKTFPGSKIDSLSLTLYAHNPEHDSLVDEWITSALAKGVEEIKAQACVPLGLYALPKHVYRFPFWLLQSVSSNGSNLSTFKHLSVCRCFKSSFDFAILPNLKTLHLDGASIAEDTSSFTNSVLINFGVLEVLRFEHSALPDNLEIVGPSLRRLELLDCSHRGIVRISAPKLIVFEHRNFLPIEKNTLSINAPQLKSTFFSTKEEHMIPPVISQFAACFLLEKLFLQLLSMEMLSMPRSIALLVNLKQLEFTCIQRKNVEYSDLMWVSAFLRASPVLQKLTYRRIAAPDGHSENESARLEPQDFTHAQLKEVEISCCKGNWCEIKLANLILESVCCLDQIVFNPSQVKYAGGGVFCKVRRGFPYWYESGRETVRRKLQDKVPAGVKLVLL